MKGIKAFRALAALVLALALLAGQASAAKRVILMIGDGMGFKHVEAARNYVGGSLAMDLLPVKLGVSTYEYGGSYSSTSAWSNFNYVKSGYTDSASAATALSTGVKTDSGNIATTHSDVSRLQTMTEYVRTKGFASGVVSSVPFSHATPAAFASHNNSRDNYGAIAREMITSYGDGTGARGNTPTVDVVIGGGNPTWGAGYVGTNEFNALKNGTTGQGWTFVQRQAGVSGATTLANAASTATKLFGLFGGPGGNLEYRNANGAGANAEEPTLADMSLAALSVLNRDPQGFFTMIEGGAIDWGAHGNNINQTIGEVIGFDQAVAAVTGWVNGIDPTWSDTLLIVTADHETGYLTKGTGVFSNVALGNPGAAVLPTAGVHYAWNSTNHTNSLVPVYAKGAGSSLLTSYATSWDSGFGTYYLDNTKIYQAMRTAVPEPGTIAALALGLCGLGMPRRKARS